MRARWLAGWATVGLLFGCNPAETFGVDEVTRMEVTAEVPVLLHLPGDALPGLPADRTLPVVAPLQVDVLQSLREAGAVAEADLIKAHRQKAERIEVLSVEYEILEPNNLPYDLEPIALGVGPYTPAPDPETAFPIGSTMPVPAGRAIAARELAYAPEGLKTAGVLVQPLAFTLYGQTRVHVPADTPVPPNQVTVRLSMKVRVHLDLAR
ncbi:MAG: hypothetical protein KC613_06085 [Myxococcales bacterium]|nr:hypothetical protein [Myxococcales bacterium]MCB9524391.1 hypothetical protein [Myxococcales bacterium]